MLAGRAARAGRRVAAARVVALRARRPRGRARPLSSQAGEKQEERREAAEEERRAAAASAAAASAAMQHHVNVHGLEQMLVDRLRLHSIAQMRWLFLVLGTMGAVLYACEDMIKDYISGETADVASRTLEEDKVQVTTKAFVEQMLSDPSVQSTTNDFVAGQLSSDHTREIVSRVAAQVLVQASTQAAATSLSRQVVNTLLGDQDTVNRFGALMQRAVLLPDSKAAAAVVMQDALAQQRTLDMASQLAADVLATDRVQERLNAAALASAHATLADPEIMRHTKEFMAEVLRDQRLAEEGGNAIWNSVAVAFTPRWLRWSQPKAADEASKAAAGTAPEPAAAQAAEPPASAPLPPPASPPQQQAAVEVSAPPATVPPSPPLVSPSPGLVPAPLPRAPEPPQPLREPGGSPNDDDHHQRHHNVGGIGEPPARTFHHHEPPRFDADFQAAKA